MTLRHGIAPLGAAILLACSLIACQKADEPAATKTATGDREHGKQIFLTLCATCHAADGTGVKGLGKSLVASEYVHKASDEHLEQLIERGRDAKDPLNTTGIAMPPKGVCGNVKPEVDSVRSAVCE